MELHLQLEEVIKNMVKIRLAVILLCGGGEYLIFDRKKQHVAVLLLSIKNCISAFLCRFTQKSCCVQWQKEPYLKLIHNLMLHWQSVQKALLQHAT